MPDGETSIQRCGLLRGTAGAVIEPGPIVAHLVPAVLLVLIGIVLFSSSGRDDAYITYWPAQTLSQFGEMLNYNGDRVEQSSSLLHVLLLALTSKLSGAEIETLGPVSSILFGIASLVAVHRLALKIRPEAAFPAALLTGTSAYFVYWSFGGLETTLAALAALCLVLAYATYISGEQGRASTLAWPILATLVFILARPEMPIVLMCVQLGAMATVLLKRVTSESLLRAEYQGQLSRTFTLLITGAVLILLLFAFRLWYFDSLFPQPVTAKLADTTRRDLLRAGIDYLGNHLLGGWGRGLMTGVVAASIAYGAWTCLRAKRLNFYVLLSILALVSYAAFILLVGGDWMEGGRFLVPIVPIAIMFVPLAITDLVKSRLLAVTALTLLLGTQAWVLYDFASQDSTGMPWPSSVDYYQTFGAQYGASSYSWFERTNRVHVRDIPTIYYLDLLVEEVSAYKQDEVSIMSWQMGMASYYVVKAHYPQVHLIDRVGLTDREITDCAALSKISGGTVGLTSYAFYFENERILEKKCDIAPPDIIFDLWEEEEVAQNGYTVVYSQRGNIRSGSEVLPGGEVPASQFIAVRDELVPALGGFEPVILSFYDLEP